MDSANLEVKLGWRIDGNLLLTAGALSFCLKDSIRGTGNVWPFSQISMSFLIFSYTKESSKCMFLVMVLAGIMAGPPR